MNSQKPTLSNKSNQTTPNIRKKPLQLLNPNQLSISNSRFIVHRLPMLLNKQVKSSVPQQPPHLLPNLILLVIDILHPNLKNRILDLN